MPSSHRVTGYSAPTGFEIHTEAGFNIGKPCYGYRARRVPHPVPAKRAKGMKKTRLEAHPVEGPVVRQMFTWRVTERLGYQVIADRLSKGAGKNRINPVSEWVWSPEPVHEALVDLETFVQAQDVAARRERSRTAAGLSPDPQARRVYPLRSYLFCDLCGRRMFGNSKRQNTWYACAPKEAWRPDGHPVILRVREDHLLDGLGRFLSEKVFGPYRHTLLDADQETLSQAVRHEKGGKVKALRRAIADTDAKSKRLIRNLELPDDLDQEFIRDIKERRAELRALRIDLERQLAAAEEQAHQTHNPSLLDHLPTAAVDLDDMPDETSRRLFEALRLEIRYDPASRIARFSITLTGDTIDTVSRTSQELMAPTPPTPGAPAETQPGTSAHYGDGLCSAPSGKPRTWERAPAIGSLLVEARSPLPGTPRGMAARPVTSWPPLPEIPDPQVLTIPPNPGDALVIRASRPGSLGQDG
jgi:site-specific DNA recombinase